MNSWKGWFEEIFVELNNDIVDETHILEIGGEHEIRCYINLSSTGSLNSIDLYFKSDLLSQFIVCLDPKPIGPVKVKQDSIRSSIEEHELLFTEQNKILVKEFLLNTLVYEWNVSITSRKKHKFLFNFLFGQGRNEQRIDKFIYPTAELDYPLINLVFYNLYYRLVLFLLRDSLIKRKYKIHLNIPIKFD